MCTTLLKRLWISYCNLMNKNEWKEMKMKMNKTKIIALLMSCLMVIGLIPGTVFAADSACEHDYVAHSNNDGTHDLSCNCGLSVENITCSDSNGDGKCDSCGYQKYVAPEEDHTHNYVAHSNNDGTHDLSCNCGLSVEDVTCLDNDGDGKCDSCGYQKYVAPEEEPEV